MTVETRPSTSPVWVNCPLAPTLFPMAPDEDESDPAREGTCAAWLAEVVIRGQYPDCHAAIGVAHENGWVVDVAMAHYIQDYVDMLRATGGTIDVERKVRLNDKIAGTLDAFGVFDDGLLIVDDLKYGFEIVDVTTPQLAIYAGALVRHLGRKNHRVTRVRLGIYQPRACHPEGIHRTWTLWPEELMKRVQQIEAAAELAHGPAPIATPGKHCRRCSGAAYCSAVTHSLYEAAHRMLCGQQRQMTPAEIANELDFLDMAETLLKARKDAVHAESEARIKSGQQIPGWMRESGYGHRRWKVSADVVHAMTGKNPIDKTKMISPKAMEDLKVPKEIIAQLTETPRTKAKLKPVTKDYIASRFGEGRK